MTLMDRMLPAPVRGGFRMEGWWVWCGSVIRAEDGRYHMFASRWPKEYPMHPGWLLASEVVRAVSDTAAGPYEFREVVLPARGAQYWDGRSTHNPIIRRHGGKYYLFYVGTTHPFPDPADKKNLSLSDPAVIVARSNKRIGLAVADSVAGPWKRLDSPILSTRPDRFDSFLVSNPTAWIREDGSVTMLYKSRSYAKPPYPEFLHGRMELGVARAPSPEGPYRQASDAPLFGDPNAEVEDPHLWMEGDVYHMMAKDMKGNLCGQFMGGMHATSRDGIHWEPEQNTLYYSRQILFDDGAVRELGNLERPFLLFEDGAPTHLFCAVSDGKDNTGFSRCTDTWNLAIPLKRG